MVVEQEAQGALQLDQQVGALAQQGGKRTRRSQRRVQCQPLIAAQGMAVIAVADTGPGVPDEDHSNIFNAFFSTKDGGMGMGLAICRSIVEAHHGRIEVGRDPELGGACFTVWLPLGGP